MLRTCGVIIDDSHVELTTRHHLAGQRISPEPAAAPTPHVRTRGSHMDMNSVYDDDSDSCSEQSDLSLDDTTSDISWPGLSYTGTAAVSLDDEQVQHWQRLVAIHDWDHTHEVLRQDYDLDYTTGWDGDFNEHTYIPPDTLVADMRHGEGPDGGGGRDND